jgi:hypothetical protein
MAMGSNGSGRITRYITYRNGIGDLTALLRLALASYREQHGSLPAGVVVHKTAICEAQQALKSLALSTLPAIGCGGCLVGEVWLAVDGSGDGGQWAR